MNDFGQDLPLRAHTLKLLLIRRITLNPQTRREHELPDRSAEARQEGIEWLRFVISFCIPLHLPPTPERMPSTISQ